MMWGGELAGKSLEEPLRALGGVQKPSLERESLLDQELVERWELQHQGSECYLKNFFLLEGRFLSFVEAILQGQECFRLLGESLKPPLPQSPT
uniref:Uncharacterized protein n=1 Tax=viral metagenome TaxID=1070528 RepID=A0A6H1ZIR0_9ZZZZ